MISIPDCGIQIKPINSSIPARGLRRVMVDISLPTSKVMRTDVVRPHQKSKNILIDVPGRLKLARDDRHDDPDDHPYNRYSNDDKEQDRRAHEDYDWLRRKGDERKNRRNRDNEDDE